MIPIHLMELSPGSFRTFVVGTSYQLGNLASSASSTIETELGARFPLAPKISPTGKKTPRYKYGLVMCIFMGCVYGYVILLTFLGPEYLGRSFEVKDDSDLSEATGHGTIEAAMARMNRREGVASGSDGDVEPHNEKGNTTTSEKV